MARLGHQACWTFTPSHFCSTSVACSLPHSHAYVLQYELLSSLQLSHGSFPGVAFLSTGTVQSHQSVVVKISDWHPRQPCYWTASLMYHGEHEHLHNPHPRTLGFCYASYPRPVSAGHGELEDTKFQDLRFPGDEGSATYLLTETQSAVISTCNAEI